ncbi:MAG: hypothetical protein WCD18_16935 [Thermosynechococcaceae cyanobacterium]
MSYEFPADFEWGIATAAYQIKEAIAESIIKAIASPFAAIGH